ncbi:MAG TPA: AsmA-like C-terminal region-containing protein [Tepidisphaeraceae bacterium]
MTANASESHETPAGSSDVAPKPPRRRRRTLLWALWIFAGALGLLYVFGPILAAPFLRERLQRMVSVHLHARLAMGGLSYHFPYGLTVRDAALVATDENGRDVDLVRVKRLDLALAELPRHDRPLILERIIVHEPSVHLVMNDRGMVGGKGLVKSRDEILREEGTLPEESKHKPSDYFRLRRFEIHDGQVVYEDRRPHGDTRLPWLVWKNLGAQVDIEPSSGSLYTWKLSADNAPLAVANAKGKVDVDSADLDVEQFVMTLGVERGKPQSQLPPGLQDLLRRYEVAGNLTLTANAHLPLTEIRGSRYQAVLDLPAATARVSARTDRADRLALKLRVASEDQDAATREVRRPVTLTELPVVTSQPASRPAAPPPHPATTRGVHPPPTVVTIDLLDVGTGDTVLHVEKGQAIIDPATEQWRVKDLLCHLEIGRDRSGLPTRLERALDKLDLSGTMRLTATAAGPLRPIPDKRVMDQVEYQVVAYPRDVAVRPPRWEKPLTNVSGTVRANAQAVTFENVEGRYQGDRYFVTSARMPLDGIEREVRVEEIVGSAQLTGKVEDYPKPFEFVARQLRPSGTWYAMGWFARKPHLPPGTKPEFRFDLRSDDAGAAIGPHRIPLTNAKVQIVAEPNLVQIQRIDARSLGGTVTVEGNVNPGKGPALKYQGSGWVRDIDVKALATLLAKDGKEPKRLSGKGNLNARVWGSGPDAAHAALEKLEATGRFEILQGDFLEFSAVKAISDHARLADDPTTAGQAAGVFDVKDGVIDFQHIAISAPLLGIQGSGHAGLIDRHLDFNVVAAPLADWKDQMKRTKIPVVSDVAGEVLGGLQNMLNTASKTLLYEFHVTGVTGKPKVEPVPAPVLTEGIARLFNTMLKGERLSDAVNGQEKKN